MQVNPATAWPAARASADPGSQPAHYPNGRVPTDDVFSMRWAWLSNGKIPPTGLKPHDDLLAEFPYLGPPNSYT